MDVVVEHFLDVGEQDAQGLWDYYYEGDNYRFSDDGPELPARIYSDTPNRASFIASVEQCRASPVLAAAVEYMRMHGVREFFALGPSGGYEWLDVDDRAL